jgi:alkylation response protein AidB-like acyl-CoA dehydrogenase
MTVTDAAPADLSDAALASVTRVLAGNAARYDRTAEFPWDSIRAVHAAGLLTVGIGAAYGGRDLPVAEAARVLQALGQGDPSVALLTAMTVLQHVAQARAGQASPVPASPVQARPGQASAGRWPDGLYRKIVAESYARPTLLNAIRAEPELGAPARGGLPATTVRRTGAGWLLNGRKAYGTGSEGLAYHLVWAVTEAPDETAGEPLIGHVVVPGNTPGITVIPTWDHLGLRASSTHDIVYENVEVPAENFPGVPVSQAASGIDAAAFAGVGLSVTALYVGVARAAQEFFLTFANERVPTALGRPIATTERIQTIAGEIEAQLIQAEEVLYGLAARVDAGDPEALRRAGVAKLLITRSAITAVQTALTAIGNPGLTRHNPLERHFRDIQCCRIHPPQDDTALIAAGRRTLAAAAAPGGQPR